MLTKEIPKGANSASVLPLVFIPEMMDSSGVEMLRRECRCITPWEAIGQSHPPSSDVEDDMWPSVLSEVDAIVVRLRRVTEADIRAAPSLKVIAKHGTGVDNIDCRAASARRIPVVYTPRANTNAVAEYALTLLLALARRLSEAGLAVRAGRFGDRVRFGGIEVEGKTLGILGLGRVGRRVAQMAASGFNMRVLGYDPLLRKGEYEGPATLTETLEELLSVADFLSLHVPLTPTTERMLDARTLDLMKMGSMIVNTSRGGVIDEEALVEAIRSGRIGGAALDVFREEPLPATHPFCSIPQILLTPHISSSTKEALENMSRDAAEGILDVLNQRRPRYLVNPEIYA